MKKPLVDPRDEGLYMPLVLGYALWWTYLYSNGINGPSWLPALTADPDLARLCRLVTYLSFAAVMGAIWVAKGRVTSLIPRKRLALECSFVAAASFLSLSLGAFSLLPPWTMLASAVGIGAFSAVPIIAFWELSASLGVQHSCASMSLALALGSLAYLILAAIGTVAPLVSTALCTCCPVLSLLCRSHAAPNRAERETAEPLRTPSQKLPYALLCALLVYGIAFGLILSMNSEDAPRSFLALTANALSVSVVSALIFLTTRLKGAFSIARIYRPILPLLGTGFILFPLFGPSASTLSSGIVIAGYACSRIFAATMFADIAQRTPVSPLAAATLACLSDAGGIALGSFIGWALAIGTDMQLQTLQSIALVACGALTLLTTLLLTDSGISSIWGFLPPATSASTEAAAFAPAEEIARAKAAAFGLTPREQEIYLALVHGKTAPAIAEDLTISKATVLTHIKNIYAKAGVHSRAELISQVYGSSN